MHDYLKAAKITLVCVLVGGLTLPAVWAVGSGIVAIGSAGVGYFARRASQATMDPYYNAEENSKREKEIKKQAERNKALREQAYKIAAERRATEKQRNIQRQQQQQQQQGGR